MNEIELKYDSKNGISNLELLEDLNTIPIFKQKIRSIIKLQIDNGYRKRNVKRICCIGVPAIIVALTACIVLAVVLFPNGFGLVGGTMALIICIIVAFCIYRKGTIVYLDKAQKKVFKKTRGTCTLEIYVNNKPYRETIGCFGVVLGNNSFIFITSDPEKLEAIKDQMMREEEEKRRNKLMNPQVQNIIKQQTRPNQPVNVQILDKNNQLVQNFHVQNQHIPPQPQVQHMANPYALHQKNPNVNPLVAPNGPQMELRIILSPGQPIPNMQERQNYFDHARNANPPNINNIQQGQNYQTKEMFNNVENQQITKTNNLGETVSKQNDVNYQVPQNQVEDFGNKPAKY